MDNKLVQRTWLGIAWLLLGIVMKYVSAQENPTGVQQEGVRLVETRADDHSGTNEPPRDKRYFAFSGFNRPQIFQPTVPFGTPNNFNQQHNQFGIRPHANNQYFNPFNQMTSSPQVGYSNGRGGNRPTNNMWPGWGYGDWSSQWGQPSNNGFWGQPYGSWGQQNQWGGPWGAGRAGGNSGQWNQFGGRPVSGTWNQSGGRGGGNRPSYSYGYGYGNPYGIHK